MFPLQRDISECFYLVIEPGISDDELSMAVNSGLQVERVVQSMFFDDSHPWEKLEQMETFIPDMDSYIEEVLENLNSIGI